MKKFLVGIVVGSIGTFGALLIEAEKRHGSIKRIAAKALRTYADKLDPKWEHNYADYNSDYDADYNADYSLLAIEYPTKEIAENILERLHAKLKKDGLVLVADYMKFSNQTLKPADYSWGWIGLSGAYVYYYNTKGVTHYGIHLPEPIHVEHVN